MAVEIAPGGDADTVREALDLVSAADEHALRDAGLLARALLASSDDRSDLLDAVSAFGGEAEAVAAAAAHVAELERGEVDVARRLQSAARWAEGDTDVSAALEWLSAALLANDSAAEVEARRAIADRLPAAPAALMHASAAIVSALNGTDNEPLLDGDADCTRLANLELAPPGCDPRRRARALAGVEGAFGEEGSALAGRWPDGICWCPVTPTRRSPRSES